MANETVTRLVYIQARTLLILLTIALSAWAETASRRVLDAWLDALNSGDKAKILAYMEQYAPERASHIDKETEFRHQTGGFTLVNVEKDSETEIVALVKERGGDKLGITRVS